VQGSSNDGQASTFVLHAHEEYSVTWDVYEAGEIEGKGSCKKSLCTFQPEPKGMKCGFGIMEQHGI
jgi:hypothetical protein